MVLNNETIALINYSKDIDIEYNIKLFLIFFFIATSLILLWYSKKIERKTDISNMVYYLTFYISIIIIAFIPLYIFLLLRSVNLDVLLNYVFVFYTVMLIALCLFVLWWSGQSFLYKVFGVEMKIKKGKTYREERDYRRAE